MLTGADAFLVLLLLLVGSACVIANIADDLNDVCRDCPVCKKRKEERDQ